MNNEARSLITGLGCCCSKTNVSCPFQVTSSPGTDAAVKRRPIPHHSQAFVDSPAGLSDDDVNDNDVVNIDADVSQFLQPEHRQQRQQHQHALEPEPAKPYDAASATTTTTTTSSTATPTTSATTIQSAPAASAATAETSLQLVL